MSLDAKQTEQQPIGSKAELVQSLRDAERPDGELLLGLEHERLLFPNGSHAPVPYEGPSGIGQVLTGFARFGFDEYREGPGLPVIAMQREKETLSLEPGGQFELSGSPFRTAREARTCATSPSSRPCSPRWACAPSASGTGPSSSCARCRGCRRPGTR
jgi:glutamate--cysteine ligase